LMCSFCYNRKDEALSEAIESDNISLLSMGGERKPKYEKSIRPMYYLYMLVCVMWFLLQSLLLLVPTTGDGFIVLIDTILYEGHGK
jgi:hypothetical protein